MGGGGLGGGVSLLVLWLHKVPDPLPGDPALVVLGEQLHRPPVAGLKRSREPHLLGAGARRSAVVLGLQELQRRRE